MKNKIRYIYEIYKQTINTSSFIVIFSLSILGSFFTIFSSAIGDSYLVGLFNVFWSDNYITYILLLNLFNTLNVYNIFNKNDYFILRINNKKTYLKQLLCIISFSNLILTLLNIILCLIFLNVFNVYEPLAIVKNYHMNVWIYVIFTIFEFLILNQIISLINILLLKICNNKIVVFANIFLYFVLRIIPIKTTVINNILALPLSLFRYFGYQMYANFNLEIICFIVYCLLLIIIFHFLKQKYLKNKKGVLE